MERVARFVLRLPAGFAPKQTKQNKRRRLRNRKRRPCLIEMSLLQPRPRFGPGLRPAFFATGATLRLRPRPIFFANVERVSA